MIRTQGVGGYILIDDDGNLSTLDEETGDIGDVGNANYDYVDFVGTLKHEKIELILEVGFQTPGIGIIAEYFDQHIVNEDVEVKYKWEKRDQDISEELLNSELKTAVISFKKDPRTLSEASIEGTLLSMMPDNYRIKFEVSLQRGDVEASKVNRALVNFLTTMFGTESIESTIEQVDIPKIMHTFRIEGISDGQEVETNLAEVVDKILIDTTEYRLHDERLGEVLAEKLN